MKHVTTKVFVKQLIIKDLFGKDSQRGVSLTYAWLANQLGHFSLGFIPSVALCIWFTNHKTPLQYSLYVIMFWLLFEIINLTVPLLKQKNSTTFKPEWGHLIFDTLTDMLYFSLGALVAALLFSKQKDVTLYVAINIVILIYPFIYWYTSRIYQQYAYFPFQYRISQWIGSIDATEKKIILDFLNKKNSKNHLLIFGNVNEGKTNLGVAIANELALKKQSCTYITATKLYSLFFKNIENKDWLWNWKNCDFLVIDDINPDNLKHNNLLSPHDFLRYVDNFSPMNIDNRNAIKNKNVIWVLGTNEKKQKEDWCTVIKNIGVVKENIFSINLSD